MTPAEHYAVRVAAYNQQRDRWRGHAPADPWAGGLAEGARSDPHRLLDANLEALATYIELGDVVLDVGGGAGRISLPLALRCREVITIDPSPAMRIEFESAAHGASIANARFVQTAWPSEVGLAADVALTTHVTYFVPDIVPFVQTLEAAARRRIIISLWSVPPPMLGSAVGELVFGGPVESPPGHRELLPVLWDMGILPEVRVLPMPMRQNYVWSSQPIREQMVDRALQVLQRQGPVDQVRARGLIEAHFEELFVQDATGYRPHWPDTVREMFITWEPRR
jgi:SAM-dependent methyltransferase